MTNESRQPSPEIPDTGYETASRIDEPSDEVLRQRTVVKFSELERRAADGSLDAVYWEQLDRLARSEPVELFPDYADRGCHCLADLAYVGFVHWNRTGDQTAVVCSITEQGRHALNRYRGQRRM
jgi:hypothetical protein